MLQDVIVGLIVLLAAVFVIYRLVRNFTSNSSKKPGCSCDCVGCCSDKENCSAIPDLKHATPNCQHGHLN
ncbi:MAG: FeoB-associated Cys-rich membrane protein [Desulfomonilaceae bacterium]|jgi:predicted ATP-grasp superfamily ATP-dependent carboligase